MKRKLFAIMTVKNEVDIIKKTLSAASSWADKIYVLDNGSWDGTWEEIIEISKVNEKVVPWGVYSGKFRDSLRQVIYNDYRKFSQAGDWWCRLDSDEFYIDDPREFISSLPGDVDHIYSASFQYYLTPSDLSDQDASGKGSLDLKYFKCNHSEIRFFRQKEWTWWPQNREWPLDILIPAKKRIRLKHYQYRSIQQINSRIDLRNDKDSGDLFSHEKGLDEEWYVRRGFSVPDSDFLRKNRIVYEEDLDFDAGSFVYEDAKLYSPKKKHWIKEKVIISLSKLVRRFGDTIGL